MRPLCFLYLLVGLLSACSDGSEEALLRSVPATESGIHFQNTITETDSFNILSHEFMYNGGGVGVADFNQDGWFDLYFTGNAVPNALYLNQGNFRFQEVSTIAGVDAPGTWSSGVSIVDINADGLPDIYVAATFADDPAARTNQLFVNQGNNEAGVPLFAEQAARYGLADNGYTTQSFFFDYDRDGDLDVYLLNDKLFQPRSTTRLDQLMEGGELTVDQFYRNDEGKYVDISAEAGITYPGFGLGAAVFDVNGDGYLDVYVSNDFISNDLLYVNQQDGTFENQVEQYFKHHSFSSMGIDVADLNGDGREELMTLDMMPRDAQRLKRTFSYQKYQFYDLMEQNDYSMQYNRNVLQLSDEAGRYREIGAFAGVSATEWSWSVLFADLDNDRRRDLAITNGYPRDITDMDFTDFNTGMQSMLASPKELLAQIPVVKVRNFFFQNRGDYAFEDKSEAWGIQSETFSNGAAVVDLDNDGDLDYVVNNINDPALVFENRARSQNQYHYLRVRLKGKTPNSGAIGAKVQLYLPDQRISALNIAQRGYLSTIEPVLHFGLDSLTKVDSLEVFWQDGSRSVLKDIAVDQMLIIDQKDQSKLNYKFNFKAQNEAPLLKGTSLPGLEFQHQEVKFFDFNYQLLLPRLYSREGPGMAVGDLNGDGVEDLVFGNGSRSLTQIYLSQADGSFQKQGLPDVPLSEDTGVLLLDSDGDEDLDLYLSSGSTEFNIGSGYYHDRFYTNHKPPSSNPQSPLTYSPALIPQIPTSTASVSAADFDQDGDLDLFVAGRIQPLNYPHPPSSYLLQNDQGRFADVTESLAPVLQNIGLVNQGLWTDFDNDGWIDLILAGEWMPIVLLRNEKGKLIEHERIPQSAGWWNSISGADLDNDGDVDYVLGNQGLNTKYTLSPEHPLLIYAHDFDQNGSVDPIIAQYREGAYYPIPLKIDLLNQLVQLKRKYVKYEDFARARMRDIFPEDTLEAVRKFQAETFASAILWNEKGDFRLHKLPPEAQFAPVYGTLCEDLDADGDLDLLLVGNRYGTEVLEGRNDALNGLVLRNEGKQKFTALSSAQSGFVVDGEGRSLVKLTDARGQVYVLAGMNEGKVKVFQLRPGTKSILLSPQKGEYQAVLHLRSGLTQLQEIYHGSGFLSHSSQRIRVDSSLVKQVDFVDISGVIRTVRFD